MLVIRDKQCINELQRTFDRLLKTKLDQSEGKLEFEDIRRLFFQTLNTSLKRSMSGNAPCTGASPSSKRATCNYSEVESDVFTDSGDGRTIDYSDADLTIKSKRGSYRRWSNLITFNARDHFKDRYEKAYAYAKKEEESKGDKANLNPSHLDRAARFLVYKSMTQPQVADYAQRVCQANQDNQYYPKESPKGSMGYTKMTDSSRRKLRQRIFDDVESQYLETIKPEIEDSGSYKKSKSRIEMRRKAKETEQKDEDQRREDLGADLTDSDDGVFSDDEQTDIANKKDIIQQLKSDPQIGTDSSKLIKAYVKRLKELKKSPLVIKKPYKQWINVFKASMPTHFSKRYDDIKEEKQLGAFGNTAKLKSEVYKRFNQPQLTEWQSRVKQESQLLGTSSYLPKGKIYASKSYDEDERRQMIDRIRRRSA